MSKKRQGKITGAEERNGKAKDKANGDKDPRNNPGTKKKQGKQVEGDDSDSQDSVKEYWRKRIHDSKIKAKMVYGGAQLTDDDASILTNLAGRNDNYTSKCS